MVKTGIFISNDKFSAYVYEKIKRKGESVYPISFTPISFTKSRVFHLGDIKSVTEYLKKEGIRSLIFIGKIPAETIFKKMHSSVNMLFEGKSALYGERILKDLISFLQTEGIEVKPLTEVLKDELAEEKLYTTDIPLSEDEKEDISTGVSLLMDVMTYRVGQTVAIKRGMIVAVEGIEGTDEMLKRAGRYCNKFVVVKMAGKDKDERFDIPVIGPDTIRILAEAGGRAIAVEAGKTIIFDSSKVLALCEKNGITLVGIKGEIR